MTDGKIELIATRWGRITEEDWEDTVNDIRAWGTAAGFVNDISRARGDILSLIEEVRFLRGQLADLCEDSRAVAEVVQLRAKLREIRKFTDEQFRAYYAYYSVQSSEWVGASAALSRILLMASEDTP